MILVITSIWHENGVSATPSEYVLMVYMPPIVILYNNNITNNYIVYYFVGLKSYETIA